MFRFLFTRGPHRKNEDGDKRMGLSMFKKIFLAIILGIFSAIFFSQYDAWTHKKIIQVMQQIAQESLAGNFSATIGAINFFSPSLTLCDVEMKSLDSDSWQWRCKKIEVTASWLQLLFAGNVDQHIIMDGLECQSCFCDSHFAIESHLMAMLNPPSVPFVTELKTLIFKNSYLSLYDKENKIDFDVFFNSSSLRIGKMIKTTVSLQDGHISYEKNKYIEKIAIDLFLSTEFINNIIQINAHLGGACVLSHLDNVGECYVRGTWNADRGRFSVRNAYNSFVIDPLIITEREIRAHGHFPLSYIVRCLHNSIIDQSIEGITHFSVKTDKKESGKIDGQIVIEDVVVNKIPICDVVKIIFDRIHRNWKMQLAVNRANQECKGAGYWNENKQIGELHINNSTDLYAKFFNYWNIKHNNFFAHITAQPSMIQGNYQATATHILNEAIHCVKGSFEFDQKILTLQGLIDANTFTAQAELYPECVLHHCSYKDKQEKELLVLRTISDKKEIHGLMAFPLIRSLLNNLIQYDAQGEGYVAISAKIALPEIIADIVLKDATIRLPQTYNFIDDFKFHCIYNFVNKSLVCENINLSLHTGKAYCKRAAYYFDEQGSLLSAHAPFILDRCLLNIKKNLFAIVSGHLLFSKQFLSPIYVNGHIFIDKAQLKENLFSAVIQKQLLSYTHSVFSLPDVPLYCNLAVETKSPILVDTGFFKTNAQVNLKIKKEKYEPLVNGSILLHSGTLNFPYKPLYVSQGIITFVPEQLWDPTIEFVARNKIKKYDVSLQVEGSLLTHHMSLDATPPLSEEQIIGLLLVGSEENNLNTMMPALIVQNVKNLIFSNNQTSFFDKYFKPLLGKLNITLVPSFTDQTGRGGLRGALEITVDDQWRAVIQKNFSLTEDTKFELEYLFSDDITFRAIRDERRDLGGEVEMRWKF